MRLAPYPTWFPSATPRGRSAQIDRGAPDDAARARELITTDLAEAEALGMAREVVRFQRLLAPVA